MKIHDRLSLVALAAEHPDWFAIPRYYKLPVGAHLACEVEDPWPNEVYESGLEIVTGFPGTCISCGRYERESR